MKIIPERIEIVEVPLQKGKVMEILHSETEIYEPGRTFKRGKKLRGMVSENSFEVRLNVEDPGRYLPVVAGEVNTSGNGSMVVLNYRLTSRTKRTLIIWLIVTVLLTIFFIAGYGRWLYGIITFSLGLVQYILTRENFRLQVNRTARILNKMLIS